MRNDRLDLCSRNLERVPNCGSDFLVKVGESAVWWHLPHFLLMLLVSQHFWKIGLIYQIWNSVVPMNKRSRNPRRIVSKKNTPLSLWGGIVLQCRLLWSLFPSSPFICRHLSGRVETHVHSLLLSINKVKYVPWVVTGVVRILSECSHPEWWPGPVALCPLWHRLCPPMTPWWQCHGRQAQGPLHSVTCLPALCTSRDLDDVTHCWKQGATSSWQGQKGWITEKLEGVKFLTINK